MPANPFWMVFGVTGLAVAAITTIIYVVVKTSKKTKPITHSSNHSVRHNGFDYYYDPDTKSITKSAPPVSSDSNSNLRKRSAAKSASSESTKVVENKSTKSSTITSNNFSEKSNDKRNISTVTKEVQTDPIDVNRNAYGEKIFPDKNLTAMSYEEKVDEFFRRNIPVANAEDSESDTISNPEQEADPELSDSSSWSNVSSVKSTDNSEKAYKKKIHRSFMKYGNTKIQANCVSHSAADSEAISDTSSSSSASSSSSWSNISSENSTDDFEKAYKKKIHKTLKKFVKNMNKESKAPSECSSTSNESDCSSISVLSEEPTKCITCEVNSINTHAQPCNHRYMCSDCALKFFKLYKKCKICRAKVDKIVVED